MDRIFNIDGITIRDYTLFELRLLNNEPPAYKETAEILAAFFSAGEEAGEDHTK